MGLFAKLSESWAYKVIPFEGGKTRVQVNAANFAYQVQVHSLIHLAAGDTLEVVAFQNAASGAITLINAIETNFLSIAEVP